MADGYEHIGPDVEKVATKIEIDGDPVVFVQATPDEWGCTMMSVVDEVRCSLSKLK